jgi:hypothetical protein
MFHFRVIKLVNHPKKFEKQSITISQTHFENDSFVGNYILSVDWRESSEIVPESKEKEFDKQCQNFVSNKSSTFIGVICSTLLIEL